MSTIHLEKQLDRVVDGPHGRPILTDTLYVADGTKKPIVIFSHGFKGFKDWGTFPTVAERMAEMGLAFVKFNFSHNGTTVDEPLDFADLQAFSKNNFSIELDDLGAVIDWVLSGQAIDSTEIDTDKLFLVGHSRGGGITILKAAEDPRVKRMVTWAAVNEFGKFWTPEIVAQWKKDRVMMIKNSRTGQDMPMDYQIYDDLEASKDRLDIPAAARRVGVPWMIVHGTEDAAVDVEQARELKRWSEPATLMEIAGAQHTFGSAHPWMESELPKQMDFVVEQTASFLLN